MKRFINKFDKRADIKTALADKKLNKPYVAYIIDEDVIDWNTQDTDVKALKFSTDDEALQTLRTDGSNIIEFSNDGATWTKYTTVGQLKFQKGMDLYIRVPEGVEYSKSVKIREVSATRYSVSGNINHLLKADGNVDEYTASNTFSQLFSGCTHLVDASKLELPTMKLSAFCYNGMFLECSRLVNAPEIFPATTLANYCYNCMFWDCTSLVNAPALPTMTLADSCYSNMFYGCTSLVDAPELPAMELSDSCYFGMFDGCTSLVNAPALPAMELKPQCYNEMFQGCSNLNYIKCGITVFNRFNASQWVQGVSPTGTFVKKTGVDYPVGSSGIPTGWTVEEY